MKAKREPYEDWGRVSFGQPLGNKSLNENKSRSTKYKVLNPKCALEINEKRLNRSNRIEGYQSVLNEKRVECEIGS